MKLRHLTVMILATVLMGCGTVQVTKTSEAVYDETNPHEVEILKTRPERPYEELGKVTANGFPPSETAKMNIEIRTKAAALGANAVILTEAGTLSDGYVGPTKWATGVAIRYK